MHQSLLTIGMLWIGLLLPVVGQTQSFPAGPDCASERLSRALRATCENMELLELTRRIDGLTEKLENTLTGAEKDALVDTEMPFVRQRNNCSNERDSVATCVTEILELRSQGLEATMAEPASVLREIPRYEFFDVPFVVRYGHLLDGRQVRVFGCFLLDPGPSPEVRLGGTIRESCGDPDSPSVRINFDRMNDVRPNFLDKQPASHWRGRIELRDGQPVLLMRLDDL